jgi:hypothetical protein
MKGNNPSRTIFGGPMQENIPKRQNAPSQTV